MPGGRGRGKRRRGVLGFLRPALLFLLLRGDNHGYSLLDELEEFGFDSSQVDPSLIYRILREMEADGLVSSYLGEESLGPQRRIYQLLPAGDDYLGLLIHGLRRRREEIDHLVGAYDQIKGTEDK